VGEERGGSQDINTAADDPGEKLKAMKSKGTQSLVLLEKKAEKDVNCKLPPWEFGKRS